MTDSDDIVTRIKEAADIVQVIGEQVELKKSGSSYLGLCPFHGEKTPSFSVNPVRQFYYCFGCGEAGDVISFVMKYQHVEFSEALRLLGAKLGIPVPGHRPGGGDRTAGERRRRLYTVSDRAAALWESCLRKGRSADRAHAYLKKRGVDAEVAARFRLGFAPAVEAEGWNFLGSRFSGEMLAAAIDAGLLVKKEKGGTYDRFRDRIVFPIFTPAGQVCGFSGRILGDGQPKYLNSPESPIYTKSRLLFGLYQAKEAIRKSDRAVLVEGNFDMISLFAAGCENVVAPLGTALTREQLRLLKKFTSNAVLLFDGDAAGRRAAARATPLFFREGMSGRVALLPDGCDPDSYVRQFGVEALRGLLEEAKELPEFTVERLVEEHGLTFDGKIKIVEELKPLLAATGSRVKRELFLRHFEQQLGMENGGLAALEEEIRRSPQQGRAAETPPSGGPPAFGHESGAAAGRLLPQAERMSRQQQQVTASLLLNPDWYPRLAEAGVQRFLRGTPGEVIFLRLGELLRENAFAEPEELLNVLAEGDERNFAADILLNPPQPAEEGGECRDAELAEVLNTLGVVQEKENLHSLNEQIRAAEESGDHAEVRRLLGEQHRVAAALANRRQRRQ